MRRKIEIDGYEFDSKEEVTTYERFKRDPDIQICNIHPTFTIFPKHERANGTKLRSISYTADFFLIMGGRPVIVEVKTGWSIRRPDYPLRRKLFLKEYDFDFWEITYNGKEVKEKWY